MDFKRLSRITDSFNGGCSINGGSGVFEYCHDLYKKGSISKEDYESAKQVYKKFKLKGGALDKLCKDLHRKVYLEFINTKGNNNPQFWCQEEVYVGGTDIDLDFDLDYGFYMDAVTGEIEVYGDNEEGKQAVKEDAEKIKKVWFEGDSVKDSVKVTWVEEGSENEESFSDQASAEDFADNIVARGGEVSKSVKINGKAYISDSEKSKKSSKKANSSTMTDQQYQDAVEDWLTKNKIDWRYVDAERGQVINGVFCNYLKFPDQENAFNKEQADKIAKLLRKAPEKIRGPKNWGVPDDAVHWEGSWWILWNVVDERDYESEKEYDHDMRKDEDWIW